MSLNVVMIAQRQSPNGMALLWSPTEGVSAYQIFVASRKMAPEELEAAALLNGTDDCFVAKVGAEVQPLVDDIKPPPPPASLPLEEPIDLPMQGATQTWDGLRIYWDRDPRAAAYEIIASDHQLFGDELSDALAGKADFTTIVAVAPAVTCVLDNTTARESRGWYAVLVRDRDGRRAAHPFKVGDAAASGRTSGPFLNPNRTGELRAEVEGLIADAREQWGRWKGEQDGGARREAQRMVGDALLIWPDYPASKKMLLEMA